MQSDAGDAAAGARDQVEHQRVLDDLDPRVGVDGGDQRALDLGAGRVASRVRDPVAEVAALAGERELAGGGVVELGARAR